MTTNGVQFFIAYARKHTASSEFAAALLSALRRRGHTVFFDKRLPAGVLWQRVIARRIKASDVFVVLLSERVPESYVPTEIRIAAACGGHPRIIPVWMGYRGTLGAELDQTLSPINDLEWWSEDDTEHLINEIEKAAQNAVADAEAEEETPPPPPVPTPVPTVPSRRRRLIPAAAIAAVLLLLFGFLYSGRQIRALENAPDERAAHAAYRRLKVLEWLIVPNAWLIGSNDPDRIAEVYWSKRASQLDADATGRLGRAERHLDFDSGLLLASLAALKRDAPVSARAKEEYERRHYGKLVVTLRHQDRISGHGLAAWPGNPMLVAEEARIWSCALPQWDCSARESLTAMAVEASTFLSAEQLVTVEETGKATQWNVVNGRDAEIDRSTTAVAAAPGELALGRSQPPHVMVRTSAGAAVPMPGSLSGVERVVYGPCDNCLSVLANHRVFIWNLDGGTVEQVERERTGEALAIAATVRGRRLAIAWDDGQVLFLDDSGDLLPRPDAPGISFARLRSMAISDSGKQVAIIHDGKLTLFDPAGSAFPLIDSEMRPSVVAAVYAGDLLVTRTLSEVRIWDPSRPSMAEELPPSQMWIKWRKQLGITVDAGGEVVPAGIELPQLGWSHAAGRVASFR